MNLRRPSHKTTPHDVRHRRPSKRKLEGDTIKGKSEFERDGQNQSRDWEAKREKKS